MPLYHSPEESVKKVEADAEVGVHEAFAVHTPVMNVVQPSGSKEPRLKQRNPSHPEVLGVHSVVQVTDHQDGPAEQCAHSDHLLHCFPRLATRSRIPPMS